MSLHEQKTPFRFWQAHALAPHMVSSLDRSYKSLRTGTSFPIKTFRLLVNILFFHTDLMGNNFRSPVFLELRVKAASDHYEPHHSVYFCTHGFSPFIKITKLNNCVKACFYLQKPKSFSILPKFCYFFLISPFSRAKARQSTQSHRLE